MTPLADCMLFAGSISGDGYGRIGKASEAHRVFYEYFVGVIPEGLEIDHTCRVRRCVNPDHLEAVTHQENIRRAMVFRHPHLKDDTHCKHGHERSKVNTYFTKSGYRTCRPCNAKASAKLKIRKLK